MHFDWGTPVHFIAQRRVLCTLARTNAPWVSALHVWSAYHNLHWEPIRTCSTDVQRKHCTFSVCFPLHKRNNALMECMKPCQHHLTVSQTANLKSCTVALQQAIHQASKGNLWTWLTAGTACYHSAFAHLSFKSVPGMAYSRLCNLHAYSWLRGHNSGISAK